MIEMLGKTDIANLMGISPAGVAQLVDAGRLPAPDAQVGPRPLWNRRTFDTWFLGYQAGQRTKRRAAQDRA